MREADIPAASRLVCDSFRWSAEREGYAPEQISAYFAERGSPQALRALLPLCQWLVAWKEDTIVGIAALKGDKIDKLYVERRFLRQGIGRRLFRRAEELIARAGHKEIVVGTGFPGSIPFYRAMGLRESGRKTIVTGPCAGKEVVLLRKPLLRSDEDRKLLERSTLLAAVSKNPAYCTSNFDAVCVDYMPSDESLVEETRHALREALSLLSTCFHLKDPFPRVHVVLAPSRPEFDRCVREILGVRIESPSRPSRVALPQRTDLVVLSPRVWEKEYNIYSPQSYQRLIAHEAVHIVEEHLSPNIEQARRWWGEGLAMFLSEQWRDSPEIEEVRRSVALKRIPPLAEIDVSPRGGRPLPRRAVKRAYAWGWTLVMFMNVRYGWDTIKNVVTNGTNGDVFRTAAIDRRQFELDWKAWLASGLPRSDQG